MTRPSLQERLRAASSPGASKAAPAPPRPPLVAAPEGTSAPLTALEAAQETVSQMFSAANKAEMTTIEGALWTREIERLGPGALLAFAEFWMSGSGQGGYRRPPTIDDFLLRADPAYINAAMALHHLAEAVRTTGPYSDPRIDDPKLRAAVTQLGGWARVCQDMPDPASDFAYKRFAERFRAAWTHSEGLQVRNCLAATPLQGLISAPRQFALSAPSADSTQALCAPGNA